MPRGTGSTLVLRPTGLDPITFDLAAADDLVGGGYTANLDLLRLGEDKREVVEYAQRVSEEGGSTTGVLNPLVPLTFPAVVRGTSRADMLERVHKLRVALQVGGRLEFKPEDLPAGVTSSYYAYLRSGPGGLVATSRNRWDAPIREKQGVSLFTVQYNVNLMTFPLLLSDPSSPVTVVSATTIQNRDDATGDNYVTVPAASLKGDSRALLQISMRNLETGSFDDITGVYIFPRIYGLTNYKIVFEPGTIVVGATNWSTQSDASRSGGSYQRLTPSSNNVTYRLQYQVSNWTDFVGRHLLMLACRDNGGAHGAFEARGGWSLGSGAVLDPTRWRSVATAYLGEWVLFSLGELEFPGTQIVDVEASTAPYYELEVRRISGFGTFDVDCFVTGPVDLRPIFVDCSERTFLNDHRLLLSNLEHPVQVAHIVNQSSYALVGPVKPLGLLPLANCGKEAPNGYRLYFLWERREGSLVVDEDFSGYSGNWHIIEDCDDDGMTTWSNATDTLDRVEGTYAQYTDAAGNPVFGFMGGQNYGGWSADDYFVAIFKGSTASDDIRLELNSTNYHYFSLAGGANWHIEICKKGDFLTQGSPTWLVNTLRVIVNGDRPYFDHWRWSKKDPGATQPNDFGTSWDYFITGAPWFVCTDMVPAHVAGNPFPVAGGGAEQLLLSSMADKSNIKMKATCYVFASSVVTNGKIGIVARCSDGTSGSEDCYALVMDSDADTLTLYKYVAGTPTALGSVGFTVNTATWYWLGIECYEGTITGYAHATEGSLWDIPLIQVSDAAHATGKCGLIVTEGMGRFDDVEVWAETDRYMPADEASIEVKALLRSVHPHYE